jgi:hypothetical protein
MPWERVGQRRYYYRNLQISGRSVRRYVGTGPVAELAAAADDLRKLKRAIEAREQKAEQARWQTTQCPLLNLCTGANVLTKATLLCAGFYQHARSSWRRKQHALHHVNH